MHGITVEDLFCHSGVSEELCSDQEENFKVQVFGGIFKQSSGHARRHCRRALGACRPYVFSGRSCKSDLVILRGRSTDGIRYRCI